MALPRHIAGKNANLAVGDLPRRSGILPADTARGLALLQKAGLVDHQHRVIVGQRFERIITHDVAQIIGIPTATPQDRLLPPGTGIAGRFGPHPARLAPLLAKQTVQQLPRRRRNPLLREQRPEPRLHIPQRRRPKLQRRLDRCTTHTMTSESWWFMDSEPRRKCNCNAR
jgi:hypothetical protein